MLKKDKTAYLDFVSGDANKIRLALSYFQLQELGHFEDHPVSKSLVLANLNALLSLWDNNPECRDWILQLIADAQITSPSVKPLIASALSNPEYSLLPTVLYLIGTQPELYSDVGRWLIPLASHPDKEVRWRVAWFISKQKALDSYMFQAVDLLRSDPYDTTQVYVRICLRKV